MSSSLKQSEAAKNTTINQKNDTSSIMSLSQLLQIYGGKWIPAPDGPLAGANDAKTLGEWLSDPRVEPYLNMGFFFNGPLGSDSYWSGYTVLETEIDYVFTGLLMTPNPSGWQQSIVKPQSE